MTIAYQRDEGYTGCEATIETLEWLNDPKAEGIEFTYLFGLNGQWLYFPTGEAEFGIRNVKEDLDANTVQYGSFYSDLLEDMDLPGDETEEPEYNISFTQI